MVRRGAPYGYSNPPVGWALATIKANVRRPLPWEGGGKGVRFPAGAKQAPADDNPHQAANVGRPFMADIKKYRGRPQSAPAVCMITDAAMRLPQAKENADNRRRF